MTKVCRICLSTTRMYKNLSENIDLETAEFAQLTYLNCFQAVISASKMLCGDATHPYMPQQICFDCSAELCTSYSFLCKVQKSDLKLRSHSTAEIYEENDNYEGNYVSISPLISENKSIIEDVRPICIEIVKQQSTDVDEAIDNDPTVDSIIDVLPAPKSIFRDATTDSTQKYGREPLEVYSQGQSTGILKSSEHVECKVCKRSFAPNKYSKHFRKVHSNAPNGFQCPKCPKAFAYPYRLKNHYEIHHGVRSKDVACAVCPKKFYSKKLLNTHMISHSSVEINHKCELCGKGFQRIAGLRRHMIMHEGGREPCKECNKRFPNLAELRIHMLTHTKETPFLCAICGKAFRRQGPLSYHMRKHRGEKYSCIHCGQEFTTISSMRRHEYKHIGLPFKCPRCNAGQATRKILERHVSEVHLSELTAEEIRNIYNAVQNSRLQ